MDMRRMMRSAMMRSSEKLVANEWGCLFKFVLVPFGGVLDYNSEGLNRIGRVGGA